MNMQCRPDANGEPTDWRCPACEGDLRSAIAKLSLQIGERLQSGQVDGIEWYALSRLAEALDEVSKRASALDYIDICPEFSRETAPRRAIL